MTMPQGPFGTLHDLVSLYAKKAQAIPQLIAMHYAVEVRATQRESSTTVVGQPACHRIALTSDRA